MRLRICGANGLVYIVFLLVIGIRHALNIFSYTALLSQRIKFVSFHSGLSIRGIEVPWHPVPPFHGIRLFIKHYWW